MEFKRWKVPLMRINIGFQIGSESLSLEKLSELIEYSGQLVRKGPDRIIPSAVPASNTWNGGIQVTDSIDINMAVKACFDQYPEIMNRIRALRLSAPDIECTLYINLRPFTKEYVLLFDRDIVQKLSDLQCKLSIEYFDDE